MSKISMSSAACDSSVVVACPPMNTVASSIALTFVDSTKYSRALRSLAANGTNAGVGEAVGATVGPGKGVAVGTIVGTGGGVAVRVGVAVGAGLDVDVGDGGSDVAVGICIGVTVGVGVCVHVGIGEAVGIGESVGSAIDSTARETADAVGVRLGGRPAVSPGSHVVVALSWLRACPIWGDVRVGSRIRRRPGRLAKWCRRTGPARSGKQSFATTSRFGLSLGQKYLDDLWRSLHGPLPQRVEG